MVIFHPIVSRYFAIILYSETEEKTPIISRHCALYYTLIALIRLRKPEDSVSISGIIVLFLEW